MAGGVFYKMFRTGFEPAVKIQFCIETTAKRGFVT